jgi:phospholipid/cholesterol/gamma-HCH transport system ATP-binding protein
MSHLVFNNVNKAFGETPVLRAVTSAIELKNTTFIVGRSGSGKSVLCRLAVGLLRPDAGTISLLGTQVDRAKENELMVLRKKCPYVVQEPALLDWKTLAENVSLTLPAALSDGRVRDVLRVVGLEDQFDAPASLGGPGVKKRAALARAMLLNPVVMFIDEPTTGLDSEAALQVNKALAQLANTGIALVIISHDYQSLKSLANQVYEVANQSLYDRGTASDFLAMRATKEALSQP